MEVIYSKIEPILNAIPVIKSLFKTKYKLENINLINSIERINIFLTNFKDDLYVNIEYPYVDKTYRDTYYNYFASKRDCYPRETIRLSFFSKELKQEEFRRAENLEDIESSYLGFLVIRPTFPSIIGRNVINPKAFKNHDISICSVKYNTTVNGVKIDTVGFPHSSQDTETITCAETTVWSILEYFGTKYAEYSPALPSKVNEVLGRFSFERLLPSKGLTAGQISYALRELCFGVKIYSRGAYDAEFENLLKIYVESGIPVVIAIQNKNGIGHALNIIGRKNINAADIDKLPVANTISINGIEIKIYDFSDIDTDYVFIDDNHPPYTQAKLSNPASNYTDARWAGCTITNFIVPLYPKIYMEAGEAKTTSLALIRELISQNKKEILVKTFLASSRSFKNHISLEKNMNDVTKELLIGISMPKFIWITEISDKKLMKDNQIDGMIILDATEPKKFGIIAALIENNYIGNDLTKFVKIQLPLQTFSCYTQNFANYGN